MAEFAHLLMLIGAATPPGRLAAAIAAAADAVRSEAEDIGVDIMNLAETPIDACDGRPLDGYGAETRRAIDRIAAADAVLIAAPVYRASFPGVLKNLLDIAPVGALQGKPVGIVAMGGSARSVSRGRYAIAPGPRLVWGAGRADQRLPHRCGFPGRPADSGSRAQGFGRTGRDTADVAPSPRPSLAWSGAVGWEI